MMHQNRLRRRLLLALLAACIAILGAQTIIRQLWTLPSLEAMAEQNDRNDLLRVEAQLQQEIESFVDLVYDSAAWDRMYQAAIDRDSTWFNDNYIIDESLRRLDSNGWYLYDNEGQVIAGESVNEDFERISVPQLETTTALAAQDLIIWPEEVAENGFSTITKIRFIEILGQPAITVAVNVSHSSATGPSKGTLLLWSIIDTEFIEGLTPGMQRDIEFIDTKYVTPPLPYLSKVFGQPITNPPRTENGKLLLGVGGTTTSPLFMLSVTPRERPFNAALFDSSLITGLLITASVMVLFYLFINQQLLSPLAQLLASVNYAVRSRDFSIRSDYKGHNELHNLGKRMNQLFALIETQNRELLQHNQRLKEISHQDPLTELANRRYLDSHLKRLAVSSAALHQSVAMLVVDVDFFKAFNDYYGHSHGDIALRRIAQILRDATHKANGLVARYGGEEFVIVMENTNEEEALTVAENLRAEVENAKLAHQGRIDNTIVTISIGVAIKAPHSHLDADKLFKQADAALYQAKAAGRNRINSCPDKRNSA